MSDPHDDDVATRAGAVIDLRRRPDARLQVSRIAAELFWRDGVAATRGEDIARIAGISTRTLWRYFRVKEECVEPVLAESGRLFVELMQRWPAESSLEEHLARSSADGTIHERPDDRHAMRMILLGETEPTIRSAWLMVCDAAEREMVAIVAGRLARPAGDLDVRRIAGAVSAAIRVINDDVSVAAASAARPIGRSDVHAQLGRAVRESSGGLLGDAVTDNERR